MGKCLVQSGHGWVTYLCKKRKHCKNESPLNTGEQEKRERNNSFDRTWNKSKRRGKPSSEMSPQRHKPFPMIHVRPGPTERWSIFFGTNGAAAHQPKGPAPRGGLHIGHSSCSSTRAINTPKQRGKRLNEAATGISCETNLDVSFVVFSSKDPGLFFSFFFFFVRDDGWCACDRY